MKRIESANRMQENEQGKVAYLLLYFMGAPVGLLLVLWVLFGSNLFGAG